MTNGEAIEYLEYLRDNYTRDGSIMCQAVDVAISVLKPKPIRTNGDRIRQMTDEKLACYIRQCACCEYEHDGANCVLDNCTNGITKWLKQEACNESDAEKSPDEGTEAPPS